MDTLDLKPLKILAKDLEDLKIMSAHLQDSIVPYLSMQYDPKTETFQMLTNRFCWEHDPQEHEGKPIYHRVHSGFEIHHVKGLKKKGFTGSDNERMYNLLTINGDKEGVIHLVFSDHHEIQAHIADMHVKLGDVTHPWPTHHHPKHIHEHVEEYLAGENQ